MTACRTPDNMDRLAATVAIADGVWLEYDFEETVTLVHAKPGNLASVSLTPNQAVGVISGVSMWLVSFFDSKAARVARHDITGSLWLVDNTEDRITLCCSSRIGQHLTSSAARGTTRIVLAPSLAAKTAAALAGWLQARPSWSRAAV